MGKRVEKLTPVRVGDPDYVIGDDPEGELRLVMLGAAKLIERHSRPGSLNLVALKRVAAMLRRESQGRV